MKHLGVEFSVDEVARLKSQRGRMLEPVESLIYYDQERSPWDLVAARALARLPWIERARRRLGSRVKRFGDWFVVLGQRIAGDLSWRPVRQHRADCDCELSGRGDQ